MQRRHFMKVSGLAGGVMLLSGFAPALAPKEIAVWEPNFFLKITAKNEVIFQCSQAEIGQGTPTGLSMVLADELGARWEDVRIEFADGNPQKYPDVQYTGGSNGIRLLWKPVRQAAATAREMLIQAAAKKWQIPTTSLQTENSFVWQSGKGKKIAFGALIEAATALPVPREVALKPKKDFKFIGKSLSGQKNKDIILGNTTYSSNIHVPGMVYAVIARAPVWGGKVKDFDAKKAKAMPGVLDVFPLEEVPLLRDDYLGGVRAGVVVVAKTTWQAIQARKALNITWAHGPNAQRTEQDVKEELLKTQAANQTVNYDFLNASSRFEDAKETITAIYESPYQVNACMEPLNAVAHHQGNRVEVWVGTQCSGKVRDRIAETTKLPPAAVHIHSQPAGGGFGRRFFIDYVEEAVMVSEKINLPVQVLWTREDAISTSKYHPFRLEFWEAALDAQQEPIAVKYRGVVSRPMDYRPFPYALPVAFHEYRGFQEPHLLPRASWRSVAAHPWGLGLECFIDELAHKAGKDPLTFRVDLLQKALNTPEITEDEAYRVNYPKKMLQTLELAAEKAGWNHPPTPGRALGVSAICYNQSTCVQIVEVSLEDQQLKIHKVTAAIHCGLAVNPSQVKSQVEGSIVWGLGAVLHEPIQVKQGEVLQKNFDTYKIINMRECPEIAVHIVDSDDSPTGTGEPAVPGIAPAIYNAIYSLTGKRLYRLPFRKEDLES